LAGFCGAKGLPGRLACHLSGIVAAMTSDNDCSDEPTIFSATITPHRSLGNVGFLILMLVIGGVSFAAGVAFLMLGAWPVFGFFGLDVLLIYWAFRVNYRAARAYEQVWVTASTLTVRKVSHRGQVAEWTLNPLWTRLDKQVHQEYGIEKLFLVSHGRKLAIANFLGPDEKETFAAALAAPLREARRGPTRPVPPRWFGAPRRTGRGSGGDGPGPRLAREHADHVSQPIPRGRHAVARTRRQSGRPVHRRHRLRHRAPRHCAYPRQLAAAAGGGRSRRGGRRVGHRPAPPV